MFSVLFFILTLAPYLLSRNSYPAPATQETPGIREIRNSPPLRLVVVDLYPPPTMPMEAHIQGRESCDRPVDTSG